MKLVDFVIDCFENVYPQNYNMFQDPHLRYKLQDELNKFVKNVPEEITEFVERSVKEKIDEGGLFDREKVEDIILERIEDGVLYDESSVYQLCKDYHNDQCQECELTYTDQELKDYHDDQCQECERLSEQELDEKCQACREEKENG